MPKPHYSQIIYDDDSDNNQEHFKERKRNLTPTEIENIISFIKPNPDIPRKTAVSLMNLQKKSLRDQLVNVQIYPSLLDELQQELEKYYYTSILQAGESVGVICGQSIGEQQTQSTLNTFHKAGQSEKTVTSGVPRFHELLNATKKPKNINHKIYFVPPLSETIQILKEFTSNKLVGLTLGNIADRIEICVDKKPEIWYESFTALYGKCPYESCISVKLDKNKLFDYKITMKDIVDKLYYEYNDIFCIFSPLKFTQLDIFVDVSRIVLPVDKILYVTQENKIQICLEECFKPKLEKMYICGIPGLTDVFYSKIENPIDTTEKWFVETNCSSAVKKPNGYKKIMAIPGVDTTRTISNNVWDMYETLGIEATKNFLLNEFTEIMGPNINVCHTKLLVDRMTFAGTISSITRFTLKKDDTGPMGRAAFEETLDNFVNAACQGEVDTTKGVASSIVCGKKSCAGTGMFGLRLDIDKLPIVEDDVVERATDRYN